MNVCRNLVVTLGFILAGAGNAKTAGIDIGPVIVVPGRHGVPIMVNGQDVSGAVIEGDWGLGQPHAGITIIRPRLLANPRYSRRRFPLHASHGPVPGKKAPGHGAWEACRCPPQASHAPWPGHFFPGTGRKPRLGRDEVIPPADRPLPPKAEVFQRNWWSESPDLPASTGPLWYLPLMGVDVDGRSRRHGPRQPPDR